MKKLIILASLLFALPVGASFDNNLYYGMTGSSEVSELQEFLTTEGVYSGPITGNFYSLTLAGVKAFQTANDITPISGYFGPLSRGKANEILSQFIGSSNEQAIVETGTTTPAVEPPKTTDDVIVKLQEQINSLLSQISILQQQASIQQSIEQQIKQQTQAIQQQQETISQIQQNTQQIAQNTTTTTATTPIEYPGQDSPVPPAQTPEPVVDTTPVYSDLQVTVIWPLSEDILGQTIFGSPSSGGSLDLVELSNLQGRAIEFRKISFTVNKNSDQFYNLRVNGYPYSVSNYLNPVLTDNNGYYYCEGTDGNSCGNSSKIYSSKISVRKQSCKFAELNNCGCDPLIIDVDLSDWIVWDETADKQIELTGTHSITATYSSCIF